MLLLHMQEIVPVDFRRAFCPLEGGGGGAQTYWHQAYRDLKAFIILLRISDFCKPELRNRFRFDCGFYGFEEDERPVFLFF